MSASTLNDLSVLPPSELDKKSDGFLNGNPAKPFISKSNGYIENGKNSHSLPSQNGGIDNASNGSETGNIDIEYIETEKLKDLYDVDSSVETLIARLDSKDWVNICEALNNVRQISIYHKEKLLYLLGAVIPLIVKSVKNPRSAVCKTAIMTCADVFTVYSDLIVDSLDQLLVQLFLKSSQDKRFVCEAAEAALMSMTTSVSPASLLPKLEPYLKNKNPRIRAKASVFFSRCVSRLGTEGVETYGINKLIQVAATQLSDQLPESREAARKLALELQSLHEKCQASRATDSEDATCDSWEALCQANLSPLSAAAILRITCPKVDAVLDS